jgi:hypothetical protein
MITGPESYWIPTGEITLASLGRTSANNLKIENEWDFIWLDGFYTSDQATIQNGTDLTHGGALIAVQPSGGAKRIMQDQVPISHVFRGIGLSTGPKNLHYWARFDHGSTVTLDLTNLIAAQIKLRLTFIGIKLDPGADFPVPGSMLAFQL